MDYAPTVPTAATTVSLELGLEKLREQYDKICECMEEIQDNCEDEDVLESFELEEFGNKLMERFEANRSILLDCINALGIAARQPVIAGGAVGGGGGGGGGKKLAVNKSLKPFTLLASHNPTEFKCWVRQFRGYYRSSNMELLEVPDQQLYLQSCVEPQLYGRVQNRMDDATAIWGAGGCMEFLEEDFKERWPLFNRRMAFFTSEQGQGQDLSAWICHLEELADEAEIEDIKMADILLFRILTGTVNLKFRGELTKLPNPTLADYKRKVVDLEVARRMENSIDKNKKAIAAAVKQKPQQQQQAGNKGPQQGRMSLKQAYEKMKGRCLCCGSKGHTRDSCSKTHLSCNACGKEGHIAPACIGKLISRQQTQQQSTNKGSNKGGTQHPKTKTGKSAGIRTKEDSSASDADSEEDVSKATVVKHKMYLVTHRARCGGCKPDSPAGGYALPAGQREGN